MINVEDWAEIRRLHRAEGMPIRAIVRKLGIAAAPDASATSSSQPWSCSTTNTAAPPDQQQSITQRHKGLPGKLQ
ncbi:hypothetical protein F0L68_15650 [Solihabitans fulvus]|uniref:Transposase n=1 Tax=Solihabitans fulvus TaxID=1892852 RepID=A0A5B2XEA7_9PSEU|nr:hypothetical protein F0L68_15650 [Solihabitans fulvus]